MSKKAKHEHKLRTAIVTACREMNVISTGKVSPG